MGMLIKKLNSRKLKKVSENHPQLPNTPYSQTATAGINRIAQLMGNVWNPLSSTKQSLKQ